MFLSDFLFFSGRACVCKVIIPVDSGFYFISKGAGIFAGLMKQDLKSPDHFLYGYTADGYQLALYQSI